jgi:hypothetical protein
MCYAYINKIKMPPARHYAVALPVAFNTILIFRIANLDITGFDEGLILIKRNN